MAWCICSQETTEVVTLLFQAIKERSPDVQVRTLMTDDGKYQMAFIQDCCVLYTYMCTYFKMKSGVMVEKQYSVMSYAICYATGMLTGMYCTYVHICT